MKYLSLRDGRAVMVREPDMEDVAASVRFFQSLPEDDRLYMRVDVTRPDIVTHRIQQGLSGEVYRIVALDGDRIIADGALERSTESWRRHMAEIRVFIGRDYRRNGLGAALIKQLFTIAQQRDVQKVVVKMAAPQTAARAICQRLGFRVDATLPDYIKDREGKSQDLVVMSCTMDAMWRELKDFYEESGDWPDG